MKLTIYNIDAGSKRLYDVDKREVVIGSDPTCDIFLLGIGVCEKHVRFYNKGHHIFLDVYEGASVEKAGETIKALPARTMNFRKVMPGDYCRVDSRPFKVGQYLIQAGWY